MNIENWLLKQAFLWRKVIDIGTHDGQIYFLYRHLILPYHIGLGKDEFYHTKKQAIAMVLRLKQRKENLNPKTTTMNKQDEMTVGERLAAPTPKIFRIIRNVGLIVGATAATIISLPMAGIALPAALLTGATTAAGVAGAVSALVAQLTVDFSKTK